MSKGFTVAIYGSAAIAQDSDEAARAERLGRRLAEAGFRISNGGYTGVMEACSRGARAAGGVAIGVLCGPLATHFNRKPNIHLSETIDSCDLNERISTLMRISDAYVVLDGGIGTLAELFLAWNLIVTGGNKPLLVVGEAMRKAVTSLSAYTEIDDGLIAKLVFVNDVDEAADWLIGHYQKKASQETTHP